MRRSAGRHQLIAKRLVDSVFNRIHDHSSVKNPAYAKVAFFRGAKGDKNGDIRLQRLFFFRFGKRVLQPDLGDLGNFIIVVDLQLLKPAIIGITGRHQKQIARFKFSSLFGFGNRAIDQRRSQFRINAAR